MKRAFLIHGWGGYPSEGWRPWLKKKLEKEGFKVKIPAMPDSDKPEMGKWVPFLAKVIGKPDAETFLVGHSLGVITILRYLEGLQEGEKIGGAVFIAGFATDLEYPGYKGELSSFFQAGLNWNEIKKHSKGFIAIHSDDDPWVFLKHNAILKENLEGEAIIEHAMKHFSGDDGVNELPIALESVLKLSKSYSP